MRKDIDVVTRTVGHIPRKISSTGWYYSLQSKWTSTLLVQPTTRGLELPCILTFITREDKEWAKTKKIFQSALGIEMLRESHPVLL